jgi:HEAT repeat protein
MMTVTMKDVRSELDREEPNYEVAAHLGPEALPFIEVLARGSEVMLASKATYLASLIRSDRSVQILERAASHPDAIVRVAAASGIRNLSERDGSRILDKLYLDKDLGVRKVTVKSASSFNSPAMIAKVEKIAEQDPELLIREIASRSIERKS